jgi:hypothetical protein
VKNCRDLIPVCGGLQPKTAEFYVSKESLNTRANDFIEHGPKEDSDANKPSGIK